MDWLDAVMELLKAGKLIPAVFEVFKNTFGTEVFITIMIVTISGMLYLRGGIIPVSAFLLLSSAVLGMFMVPGAQLLAGVLAWLGISALIYKLLRG